MFVQAPPTPDNRLFLDRTLHAFNIQPQRTATDSRKLQLVLDQMKACETRILLIDEIHSILAGPLHRREAVLNTFKYLSNESGVSIVAAGTVVARDILLMLPPYSRPRPIRNKAPAQPLQPVAV